MWASNPVSCSIWCYIFPANFPQSPSPKQSILTLHAISLAVGDRLELLSDMLMTNIPTDNNQKQMFPSSVKCAGVRGQGCIGTLTSWTDTVSQQCWRVGTIPGLTLEDLRDIRFRISQRNPIRWGELVCSSLSIIVKSKEVWKIPCVL